jgi:hypothetical protein
LPSKPASRSRTCSIKWRRSLRHHARLVQLERAGQGTELPREVPNAIKAVKLDKQTGTAAEIILADKIAGAFILLPGILGPDGAGAKFEESSGIGGILRSDEFACSVSQRTETLAFAPGFNAPDRDLVR